MNLKKLRWMHSNKNQTLKSWHSDENLPIVNKKKKFSKYVRPLHEVTLTRHKLRRTKSSSSWIRQCLELRMQMWFIVCALPCSARPTSLCEKCGFRETKKLKFPTLQSRGSKNHVQPKIQNHTLFTVTMCMSTPVRRKQSVDTTCGCLRILMNKIEFQKRTHHLDLGETKNWLASTKWLKKPHPNRTIELRSNPAWTWTHQRNDQNMWFNKSHQSVEVCNAIGIISKTMHCHECSRSPANTITSNSEPKTIIQNEPTSPLRNKNVDETRMFPCHVPSHQRHTFNWTQRGNFRKS